MAEYQKMQTELLARFTKLEQRFTDLTGTPPEYQSQRLAEKAKETTADARQSAQEVTIENKHRGKLHAVVPEEKKARCRREK